MTHRIITAPVLIPDKPDCDYNRGEPPLTKQQIKKLKTTFDEYQLIDYDHNKKTHPINKHTMKKRNHTRHIVAKNQNNIPRNNTTNKQKLVTVYYIIVKNYTVYDKLKLK